MSSEDKRIIEQTASTTIPDDAFFIFDSALLGTFKISGAILKALLGADGTQALEEIANAIAEEYDSTHTYSLNDWVFHEGTLYRCIGNNVTGTWNANKWQAKTIKEFIDTAKSSVLSTIEQMLGEYLPISTLDPPSIEAISKGDIFIYQRTNKYKFYRAKADHPQGVTEFDIDDWDEFDTVADLIEDVTENAGKVADVQVKTTGDYETVVENKIAKIDLSNKADKDGMYDELYAGNLLSDNTETDNAPYLYRQSPSGKSCVDLSVVGGTVAWNQIAGNTYRGSQTTDGITFTPNDDGSFTMDGTATKSDWYIATPYPNNIAKSGHVYYIFNGTKNGSTETFGLGAYDFGISSISIIAYGNVGYIGRANSNSSCLTYVYKYGTQINNAILKPQFIDLTQAFGSTIADYVYSLEQAEAGSGIAWLKSYGFLTKDYYAYQSGKLESVNVASRKVVGFNQWDEEWEKGSITDNGVYVNTDTIRSKNFNRVKPNTEYYISNPNGALSSQFRACFFDENKTFISRTPNTVNTFTTPSNCHYFKLTGANAYGATYHNDICVNISDASKNGTYEPYTKHTYPLDSNLTLRGIPKLDANNNLYYDGDIYKADGSVKRKYGVVDLGSLSYTFRSGNYFETTLSLANNANNISAICPRYTNNMTITGWADLGDKEYAIRNTVLRIKDTAYSDATAFKTAMSGVYLVYELATPTTESAQPYTNPQLVGSTEEFIDAGTSASTPTRDVEIPVGQDSKYHTDLKAKLDELAKIPDVPSTNGTYTLKATRSASGVVYNWVSG